MLIVQSGCPDQSAFAPESKPFSLPWVPWAGKLETEGPTEGGFGRERWKYHYARPTAAASYLELEFGRAIGPSRLGHAGRSFCWRTGTTNRRSSENLTN